MRLFGLVVLLGILLTGILGGSSAYVLNYQFHQEAVEVTTPILVEVAEGDSFSEVTTQLHDSGLIENPTSFKIMASLRGKTAQLKVGEYGFQGQVSPSGVLTKLVDGKAYVRHVSFPEGRKVTVVWEQLAKADRVENNIEGLSEQEVLSRLDLHFPTSHLEGLFFPDTYSYLAHNSALSILQRAHDKLNAVLQDAWDARTGEIAISNVYELLILATIVEKESGLSKDRRRISGVLHRRLSRDMLLQVDPTVIYGLGKEFDGDLKTKHLRDDQLYNTYVHKGLPPSPICMPSRDAILAAANPQPGEEMFFIGRGDGSSQFSVTLEEHNRAVQKYLIK